MKNNLNFILVIALLLSITLVSSQPPVTFSSLNYGYTLVSIEPPLSIAQNTTIHLHIHVLNNSDSHYVNSSIICFYHLSNPIGQKINEGFLTVSTTSITANVSYSATINGGNFSTNGLYNVLIECFDGGKPAGITRVLIDVTVKGAVLSTAQIILYCLIDFLIFALMLMTLYFGIEIEFSNEVVAGKIMKVNWRKYLKIFCWGMFYVLLLAFTWISWNLTYAYSDWQTLATFIRYLFFLEGLFAIPVFLTIIILSIVNFVKDKKAQDFISKFKEGYSG